MTSRPLFLLMTVIGTAGALVLGTLETDTASAYWHARPGLEEIGLVVIIASLLSLLIGTVGLVIGRVRDRRTPAVDSRSALTAGTAWTGWALVAAAAAFAVVLASALVGLAVIEAEGGCGDASSWCGLGTAVLAYGASVASTVLAAAGGAMLGWSGRAATSRRAAAPAARPATGGYGPA